MRTLIAIVLTAGVSLGAAGCFSKPGYTGATGDGDGGVDAPVDAPVDPLCPAPPPPEGFTRLAFRKIVAGKGHACAIDTSGTGQEGRLWCWGKNDSGQLGAAQPGTSGEPLQVGTASTWVDVAAGWYHSCAVNAAGEVYCWGSNASKQLNPSSTSDTFVVTRVASFTGAATRVFAGGNGTCARTATGATSCWGSIDHVNPAPQAVTPLTVTGVPNAWDEVSIGDSHSCATTSAQQVYCWGRNSSGELGVIAGADVALADAVTRDTTAYRSLAVEGPVTCAVTTAGALHCWGRANNGHLGPGVETSTAEAVVVVPSGVTDVDIADYHACYRTNDGVAHCYGIEESGALGNGIYDDGPDITTVPLPDVASVTTGESFTCAVDTCGRGFCWGTNQHGELGIGLTSPREATPGRARLTLAAAERVLKVVTGDRHSCALVAASSAVAGRIYCWGDGTSYQVRDTENQYFATPVTITDDPSDVFEDVVAGGEHTCARRPDGTLRCWGSNVYNQLGRLGPPGVSDIPLNGTTKWANIAAGSSSSCAVDDNGVLHCWGSLTGNGATPQVIGTLPAGSRWASVEIGSTTGDGFLIGTTIDSVGALHIHGFGDDCALGLGAGGGATPAAAPAEILANPASPYTLINITAADNQGGHACAHLATASTAELWCWGNNNYLQASSSASTCAAPTLRGPPTGGAWRAPVAGVTTVDVGSQHTVALTTLGVPYGWGDNNNGALGQAGNGSSNVPAPATLSISSFATTFAEIATSGAHSCAIAADRTAVYCWGRNRDGQVGDGARDHNLPTPSGLVPQ